MEDLKMMDEKDVEKINQDYYAHRPVYHDGSFDDYRFGSLGHTEVSNNYITCNRIPTDPNEFGRCCVRVGKDHIFKSKYGYGLRLDAKHVVWLKEWQVSIGYARDYVENENGELVATNDDYAIEVILNRGYFKVKEYKEDNNFSDNPEALKWKYWFLAAKDQQEHGTKVMFRKKNLDNVID